MHSFFSEFSFLQSIFPAQTLGSQFRFLSHLQLLVVSIAGVKIGIFFWN